MDITERLDKTYDLLRSRGTGTHAAWVREAQQVIVELREKIRIFEHEKRENTNTSLSCFPTEAEKSFSHSEEKGLDVSRESIAKQIEEGEAEER